MSHRHPRALIAAAIAVILLGCDGPPATVAGPAPGSPSAQLRTSQGPALTSDDTWLALARQAPGFGGYYIDSLGYLVVQVTSRGDRAAVGAAVRALVSRNNDAGTQIVAMALPKMRIVSVDHGFAELAAWYAALAASMPTSGVTYTDIDERFNRISVGVRDASVARSFEAFLTRQQAIPRNVVALRVVGSLRRQQSQQTDIRLFTRPLIGGVRIQSNSSDCSLGANVQARDVQTTSRYFVTASHCTNVPFQPDGTPFGQPTTADPVIGDEVFDPPFAPQPFLYDGKPWSVRYSDAAIIQYRAGVASTFGKIARVGTPRMGTAFSIIGQYDITGQQSINNSSVGAQVTKLGGFGGRTIGTVVQNCTRFFVEEVPEVKTLECISVASYTALAGDSGGPIYVLKTDGTLSFEGIHLGQVDGSPNERAYSAAYGIFLDMSGAGFGYPYYGAY